MLDGNFFNNLGVVLCRGNSGEKNLWLKLFLKDAGIVNVSAKKKDSNIEPLTWGNFSLKKKQKSTNYFIDEAEIFDDMFALREKKDSLLNSLKWVRLVMKFLEPGQPDNDLLINLYWSMKLLTQPKVPPYAASWKFLWRWLDSWGLAPDLVNFYGAQNFNHDEIVLLAQMSMLSTAGVADIFSKNKISPNIRENSFKIAVSLAEKFLIEK